MMVSQVCRSQKNHCFWPCGGGDRGGMGFRCCGVSSEQLNQKGPEKPQPGTVVRPFGPVNSAHKQERGKIGQ